MGRTSVRILFGKRKIVQKIYLTKLCLEMRRLRKRMFVEINDKNQMK